MINNLNLSLDSSITSTITNENYNLYPELSNYNVEIYQDLYDFIFDSNKTEINTTLNKENTDKTQLSIDQPQQQKKSNKFQSTKEALTFFKEIVKPTCTIPKSEIDIIISKFIKNTPLIYKLNQDYQSEKKHSLSSLSLICAKRFCFKQFDQGDIIYKIGDIEEAFYFILYGKISVLKFKEINDCYMTYQEYFEYLWNLNENKEEYLLNEVIKKNYEIVKINNYDEFIKIYNVYFSLSLKEKLISNEFNTIDELKDYFISHHQTFEIFDINENYLKNLWFKKHNNNETDLINFITQKTQPTSNDLQLFEKYNYLLSSSLSEQPFTQIIYEQSTFFKAGDCFGDFTSSLDEKKATQTIRCESECIVAMLLYDEYMNILYPQREDNRQKDLCFLYDNFFFQEISFQTFDSNYFSLFNQCNETRNYILYEEGNQTKDLFFLKEGILHSEITCSIIDLHNLIKCIYEKLLVLNRFLVFPININKILSKSQIAEIKKYSNDPELASLQTQRKNFVMEMYKVKTFDLSIIAGKDVLGIEELFLNTKYLNSVKVISQKASFYRLSKSKLENLLKEEKACLYFIIQLSIQKLIYFIERLHHIKRNVIDIALYNSKLEEEQAQKVNNAIIYNDSNVLKIKQKLNKNKIEQNKKELYNNNVHRRSISEYRNIDGRNKKTTISKQRNQNSPQNESIHEKSPGTIHSNSRTSSLEYQSNLIPSCSKVNRINYNVNTNKRIGSLKKNLSNDRNNIFLINIKDKYMSLSSFEKEIHSYNNKQSFNISPGNSLMSIASFSDMSALSYDNNIATITPKIKYKNQFLRNMTIKVGQTMDKNNNLPAQSCRLNYIPLTVGEGNSTRNNEETKDKQGHIENLLFLSQLKKQKKKKLCNSSSIDNINGINVIDSHSLKQNKLKERIGPKLILPNIVKEFYKKIRIQGYSNKLVNNPKYVKKQSPNKNQQSEKTIKLTNIFNTEMNQIDDNKVDKHASYYVINRQSNN